VIIAGKDHLQGWKDIATYLARDERTVKRWEKQRGLPVRRIPGGGRANVYILVSELEAWLAATGAPLLEAHPEETPLSVSTPSVEQSPAEKTDTDEEFAEVILDPAQHPWHAAPRSALPRSLAVVLGVTALIGIVFAVYALVSAGHAESKTAARLHSVLPAYSSTKSELDDLYLQGVYLYEERTPASLERARQSFEEAIAKDPNYAPAYSGLANTYLLLREYSTMPSDQAYARALVAARRAVALDPNLAEAHNALGFISFFSSWDAATATREFETALRLNPNSATVHHWYGSMLMHQARFAEALDQLNQAQRLQPTSSAILATKAYALGLQGHRNEAADMLQNLISMDSEAVSAHRILASLGLVEPRDIPRFLDESRRLAEARDDQESLAFIGAGTDAFHRGGEKAMWSAILEKETQFHPSPQHPNSIMADSEAALGHDAQALRELNLLVDQRDPSMIGIDIDPLLAQLRHKREFQQILARVGLPPSPPANPTR
jgi:Tfp pilus assembly protein PilF